jgi:hypothetical protein
VPACAGILRRRCCFTPGLLLVPLLLGAQTPDTLFGRRLDAGSRGVDLLGDMAVGQNGTVYLTGVGSRQSSFDDYWTVAFDTGGRFRWQAFHDGSAHDNDSAAALALDRDGNVYVTGTSREDSAWCITTVKYDAAGSQFWVNRLSFPGDLWAGGVDVVVSESGDVFACGYRGITGFNYDYVVVRYNPLTGDTVWTRFFDRSPDHDDDEPTAIAADRSGNVIVTGFSNSVFSYGYDYCTIKYDRSGRLIWQRLYNRQGGTGNQDDLPWALAVDADGNVVVTGQSYDDNTDFDIATVKYGQNGDTVFIRRFNRAPADGEDAGLAVITDSAGNVFVAGYGTDTILGTDVVTIRYSASGSQLWVERWDGGAGWDDAGKGLHLDRAGNLFVTGWAGDDATCLDAVTLKYQGLTGGPPHWAHRYDTTSVDEDAGMVVAAGPDQTLFVAAQVMDSLRDMDYCLLRLFEPSHDCGAVRIVAPRDTVGLGDTVTPRALVRNHGVARETLLVRLVIGDRYRDSLGWIAAPGQEETLTFRRFPADSPGSLPVLCTTMLARDVNPRNDAARMTLTVVPQGGIRDSAGLTAAARYLRLAPNPAREQMRLSFAGAGPGSWVRIYSSAGRLAREIALDGLPAGELSIRTDRLAAGVYLVRLETRDGSAGAVAKLVKRR